MNIFRKTNSNILLWILMADSTSDSLEDLTSKASSKSQKAKIDFAVGGQAVIEGVMMRAPEKITIAVRKADGSIKVKADRYIGLTKRYKWLNVPIVRGVVNLFEMMGIGSKAINFSADETFEDEEIEKHDAKNIKNIKTIKNGKEDKKKKVKAVKKETKMSKAAEKVFTVFLSVFSFLFALAFSIFLFKFLPLGFASIVEKYVPAVENNYILFNLIDGITKMVVFLSYIYILSLFESFNRIFMYHGAEHKAIFTYEAKEDLIVENAKKQSRFHPRCGTSFILIVFLVSVIVYTFIPKQDTLQANLLLRVAFFPLIAGISYEYLKLSAKYSKNPIVKLMIKPGLAFQKLTTSAPDESQMEVGLKALEEAL